MPEQFKCPNLAFLKFFIMGLFKLLYVTKWCHEYRAIRQPLSKNVLYKCTVPIQDSNIVYWQVDLGISRILFNNISESLGFDRRHQDKPHSCLEKGFVGMAEQFKCCYVATQHFSSSFEFRPKTFFFAWDLLPIQW